MLSPFNNTSIGIIISQNIWYSQSNEVSNAMCPSQLLQLRFRFSLIQDKFQQNFHQTFFTVRDISTLQKTFEVVII